MNLDMFLWIVWFFVLNLVYSLFVLRYEVKKGNIKLKKIWR